MGSSVFKPCRMCLNARVDSELTDYNDFSASPVGKCADDYRVMIESGFGKPVRISFEHLDSVWRLVGAYLPNFCPNCGRPLVEYETKKCNTYKADRMVGE